MIVLDDDKLKKSRTKPLRESVHVSTFTATALEILRRGKLEFQRRYMGNTTETIDPSLELEIDQESYVMLVLDVRTKCDKEILTNTRMRMALPLFKERYITFRQDMLAQERAEKARAAAPEAAGGSAAPVASSSSASSSTSSSSSSASFMCESALAFLDEIAAPEMAAQVVMTDAEIETARAEKELEDLNIEFGGAVRPWLHLTPRWSEYERLDTGVKFSDTPDIMSLMYFPIAQFMFALMQINELTREYGWIPELALTLLGQLMASSFVERVNSGGKLILHEGNLNLKDETVDMLVVLRMNRAFMEQMRELIPSSVLEGQAGQFMGSNGSFQSFVAKNLLTPEALMAEAAAEK